MMAKPAGPYIYLQVLVSFRFSSLADYQGSCSLSDALFDADDLIILRHFLEVKIDRLAVVLQHLLARSGLAEVYFAVGCVVDLIEAGLDSCFIIHTFEVQLKGFMGCLADNCRRTIFV